MLDLTKMLVPVSDENPAGANEEYDPRYLQLEELAVGKPASMMGDSVVEGTDPDWRALCDNCLKLWETTRDLRVAIYLCIAEFSLEGLEGFSKALSCVEYLVESHWDNVYPQPDPEDNNDPTERLNIFAMISPPPGAYSDPLMFISKFRMLRLVPSNAYTLRDLLIVNGELDVDDGKVDPVLFQGEMHSVPVSEMQSCKDMTDKITGQLAHIETLVNEKLQDGYLNFTSLFSEIKTLQKFYESYLLIPSPAEEESSAEAAASPTDGERKAALGGRTVSISGSVNLSAYIPSSRAEALLLLKKGAEYFQSAEPTSPVPLLVSRAMRMANMSFLDLLGDVEPNALEKGREIFGVKPEAPEEE